MDIRIEPYAAEHLDALLDLSARAWAPVFESLQNAFEPEVYRLMYPGDWQPAQRQAVAAVCAGEHVRVWVALAAATPVGFAAAKLHQADRMGEVYMLAVDPSAQRAGIATALMDRALAWMKEAGMVLAMVETGGDPGHAPARSTYESLGFGLFPVARYFKAL